MNTIDSRQATIFIVVFSVIALFINATQRFGVSRRTTSISMASSRSYEPSPQNSLATQQATEAAQAARAAQEAEAARKAEEARAALAAKEAAARAAAEHAKYLATYLTGGVSPTSGNESVALVVANDDATASPAITSALAHHLQKSSVQILTSFFTPAFISDGLFNDILSGSQNVVRKLELAKSLDTLVLAHEDIEYSQSPALENLITATIRFDVHVIHVSGQEAEKTWSFTATGPGFSKDVARKAAEERLIKQITTDTNMSLN